jgi:hypothetical protein
VQAATEGNGGVVELVMHTKMLEPITAIHAQQVPSQRAFPCSSLSGQTWGKQIVDGASGALARKCDKLQTRSYDIPRFIMNYVKHWLQVTVAACRRTARPINFIPK